MRDKSLSALSVIVDLSADYYGVDPADIWSGARTRRFTAPRHVSWAVARSVTNLSFQEITDAFGLEDHTSIMSGARRGRTVHKEGYDAVRRQAL